MEKKLKKLSQVLKSIGLIKESKIVIKLAAPIPLMLPDSSPPVLDSYKEELRLKYNPTMMDLPPTTTEAVKTTSDVLRRNLYGLSDKERAEALINFAGFTPVAGDVIDVVTATAYAADGNYFCAALLLLVAFIPLFGSQLSISIKNSLKNKTLTNMEARRAVVDMSSTTKYSLLSNSSDIESIKKITSYIPNGDKVSSVIDDIINNAKLRSESNTNVSAFGPNSNTSSAIRNIGGRFSGITEDALLSISKNALDTVLRTEVDNQVLSDALVSVTEKELKMQTSYFLMKTWRNEAFDQSLEYEIREASRSHYDSLGSEIKKGMDAAFDWIIKNFSSLWQKLISDIKSTLTSNFKNTLDKLRNIEITFDYTTPASATHGFFQPENNIVIYIKSLSADTSSRAIDNLIKDIISHELRHAIDYRLGQDLFKNFNVVFFENCSYFSDIFKNRIGSIEKFCNQNSLEPFYNMTDKQYGNKVGYFLDPSEFITRVRALSNHLGKSGGKITAEELVDAIYTPSKELPSDLNGFLNMFRGADSYLAITDIINTFLYP